MKSSWVSDKIEVFENNIKQSFRNSFRSNRNRHMKNIKQDNPVNVKEDKSPRVSNASEHCFTVEEATRIFENKDSTQSVDANYNKCKSFRMVSLYDIFSGSVDDYDIPPIEDEIEEDGVYPIADHVQLSKQKKPQMKANAYGNRKSHNKKPNASSTIDRETAGVIIRMRNQESYYDGKDKYQSQLPEPSIHHENNRRRRSLYTQTAVDKSIDQSEADILPDKFQNSIIYPDIPLPLVDKNSEHYDCSVTEEDTESLELEPIDNDSYPDNKVFQLMSDHTKRLRWAETEEGKKLIKIQKLDSDTIKFQEAQFEVITSEASYNTSLNILVDKLYKSPHLNCYKDKATENVSPDLEDPASPEFKPVLSAMEKHHLFSNILEIHIVSCELLKALEFRWRENPLINDLSDIIVEFCQERLKPYVTYLRNQKYQDSTYQSLKDKPEFREIINKLAEDPECYKRDLWTFLLMPFQRITNLKNLMLTVKKHTPSNLSTTGVDLAIECLNKLIIECSDQKSVMEDKEKILKICNRLKVKDKMKVSIGNKPLLKESQMKIAPHNSIASKSFGMRLIYRNNNKAQIYLFEDQLIISRRRKYSFRLPMCISTNDKEKIEVVVDTCPRTDVRFDMPSNTPRLISRSPTNFKLILSRGMNGSAEYDCTVETEKELNDWKKALSPETKIRMFNDVVVTEDYIPTSDKELELKKGQILTILDHIDRNRAFVTYNGKAGEISLNHVQYLSPPEPETEFFDGRRPDASQKQID